MKGPADPVVVCSILEPSAERTARAVERAPRGCGLVELRADFLRAGDVAGIVRRAARPAIVTVRPVREGGRFDGSEEERRSILLSALDAGAAFVDVEWGGPLVDLATGPAASHAILSHHGAPCDAAVLDSLWRAMASTRAARIKIVPRGVRASDAAAVYRLLREASGTGRPLACFALGSTCAATRIFACSWGSWATYGSMGHGLETGEGQLRARDLLEIHDVVRITADTRRFALVGRPVLGSPSPAMHFAAYRTIGMNARYVPIEADRLDDLEGLFGAEGPYGIEAFAVTIPLKESVAARSVLEDDCAASSRAVNTVVVDPSLWRGFNTDGPAVRRLVESRIEVRGCEAAVLGAGGMARAAAASLLRAGARVTLYGRSPSRVEQAAREVGTGAASLGSFAHARWDVLVQATPLGSGGETVVSPRNLNGRVVVDCVYAREPTPLVRAARARGLLAIEGFDVLLEQAQLQFERMTGRLAPRRVMEESGRSWLEDLPDAASTPREAT